MRFGEFLNEKRVGKRITVRNFAAMVGISPSFLCDLESGARAFPARSKKSPDLLEKMASALSLSDAEAKEFKDLAEESMLSGNRVSAEISEYLQKVPEAQQALRLAKEKSVSKEEWEEFVRMLKERK